MTDTPPALQLVPVDSIAVLNPRARNKRIFNELVTSIAHLGLKKPITVSGSKDHAGYELVCGQGRLEAFRTLGQDYIPAVVIDVAKEDCFVMSLVENLARRNHTSLEFIQEIGALKDRGYSAAEIAKKIDFSREYIYSILYLLEHGEERLMVAIEKGHMPHTVAVDIVRTKNADLQQILANGYEAGTITGRQVLAIRRIVEHRDRARRSMYPIERSGQSTTRTANALIRHHRIETGRQKLLIKKDALVRSRILFITSAFRRLMADEHFTVLLRAEAIQTMPRSLARQIEKATN